MQPAGGAGVAGRHQIGPFAAATIHHLRATRVEGAAAGDGVEPRHRAIDLHQPLAFALHRRDRAHQPHGVRVRGPVDHVGHRPDLDHPAGVHHHHPVAGFGDDAHVVGHQHHRGALPGRRGALLGRRGAGRSRATSRGRGRQRSRRRPIALGQLFQQRDDLGLDRHVERGGRLVGDDQLGLGRQRQRNHHPLAHATRELVRVLVDALLGRRNAGVLQQLHGALAGSLTAQAQMNLNCLGQLPAHGVERVQRGQRVLKDGADAAAADLAHRFGGQVVDALAGQPDFAAGDPAGRLQQADDGRAGERLASARLAHHAQDLAGCDVERHIVQRQQGAAAGRKFHPQVAYFKQRGGHRGAGYGEVGISASGG